MIKIAPAVLEPPTGACNHIKQGNADTGTILSQSSCIGKEQEDIFLWKIRIMRQKNWSEILEHYVELQKLYDESKNSLASEIMADNDQKDNRKSKIIFGLICVILVLAAGLIGSNMYWIYQWNSYDYISQDGEGYNYYNSDIEGDVDNGAENTSEEEQTEE